MLIAEVVGFRDMAPALGADRLVPLLDDIVTAFDGIVTAHGLRKIKTLGNSYMAAAGVPEPLAGHADRAVHVALDMADALSGFNARDGHRLQVRIGIATGAVTAGVIGKRMYLYDIWGDAVNIASRMESHGVAGRVNVSDSTRRQVSDAFEFEARGALAVEGMGEQKAWFVGRA